jgi:hypothetical protein
MNATSENKTPQQLRAANSLTIARPIPLVPPVTIALLLLAIYFQVDIIYKLLIYDTDYKNSQKLNLSLFKANLKSNQIFNE